MMETAKLGEHQGVSEKAKDQKPRTSVDREQDAQGQNQAHHCIRRDRQNKLHAASMTRRVCSFKSVLIVKNAFPMRGMTDLPRAAYPRCRAPTRRETAIRNVVRQNDPSANAPAPNTAVNHRLVFP